MIDQLIVIAVVMFIPVCVVVADVVWTQKRTEGAPVSDKQIPQDLQRQLHLISKYLEQGNDSAAMYIVTEWMRRITDLTRELAMWRSEHDPCPLSVENERLGARVAELETALKESEREVRHLLWTTHGHSGIYGDDGEMQCAKCAWHGCWDYKNAPLEEVRKAYRAAMLERAALPAPPSEGKP